MSKENVERVRILLPSHPENDTGREQIELVPENGKQINRQVREYAKEWGVRSRDDLDEAAKWDRAVRDLEANRITEGSFQRGKNPNREEEFQHPRGR